MPTANSRPLPSHVERLQGRKTKYKAFHKHNPVGSKYLRKYYKAKTGEKAGFEKARDYYAQRQS